jgi:Spy/CpxP family protein refolding chaperone
MNKSLIAIALALTTAAGSALAQPLGWAGGPGPGYQPGYPPAYGPGSGRGLQVDPARIDRRMERMTAGLNLTEAQQQEIRGILEQRRAGQLTSRDQTHAAIAAVLDPQQRAQLDQWRAQRGTGMGCGGYGQPRGCVTGYGPGRNFSGPGMGRGPGWGPYPTP